MGGKGAGLQRNRGVLRIECGASADPPRTPDDHNVTVVGVMVLVLRLGRAEIATIPIAADRLVLDAAHITPDYSFVPAR